MRLILGSHSLYIGGAAVLIVLALGFLFATTGGKQETLVTTTVERGNVEELVSVSGVVEAENTADLAFPLSGIVRDVRVNEGDVVEAGTVLATLEQSALQADRLDAVAAVNKARADRDELVAGPRQESRDVTSTNVQIKAEELDRITREQDQKIENARRSLLSTSLEATSNSPGEEATPPTVSGTYICEQEGTYSISVYRSSAESGYSFNLSGLEIGTYPASVDQAIRFGDCGLRIQFDPTSNYARSEWEIMVPNTKSSTYITNLNAYELTVDQAENAIRAAEQALELAEQEETLANADPRIEALQRANANIAQAEARLARVNAEISDRTLRAPFAGTITDVSVIPGETVNTSPVITLLAEDTFELTARIPEIDITKLTVGQTARAVFDAQTSKEIELELSFISPLATEIDGVAYYEAILMFNELPSWIRAGLNADVDVVVNERRNTTRLPTRFVSGNADGYSVLIKQGDTVSSTTIDVGIKGNDGYTEVIGVNEGDIVVAP